MTFILMRFMMHCNITLCCQSVLFFTPCLRCLHVKGCVGMVNFYGFVFSQYILYFWQERHWEKSEFVLNVLVTFRGSRLRATCAHAMTVAEPSVSLS